MTLDGGKLRMAVLADRVMTLRNRRAAVAFGLTAVLHVAILAVFALSTTQPRFVNPVWNPAFRVTLVPDPLAKKRVEPAPARGAKVERASTVTPNVHRVRAPSVVSPAPPVAPPAVSAPPSPPVSESESDTGSRLRGVLHGLAACHDFGVKPTEKERRACEDRLGRLADAAPTMGTPPPPVGDVKPPQKAGTCRMNLRTLLSPRVKCKFW
jgi:hypothetical protein